MESKPKARKTLKLVNKDFFQEDIIGYEDISYLKSKFKNGYATFKLIKCFIKGSKFKNGYATFNETFDEFFRDNKVIFKIIIYHKIGQANQK